MKFARWLFLIAGVYGLLLIPPQYFMEEQINREYPPAITHPEYFYGFVGVVTAWQLAFLVIASDPPRYRPLMLPSVVEKFSFGIAAPILFAQQRLPGIILVFAGIDMVLGLLFLLAWWKLKPK